MQEEPTSSQDKVQSKIRQSFGCSNVTTMPMINQSAQRKNS